MAAAGTPTGTSFRGVWRVTGAPLLLKAPGGPLRQRHWHEKRFGGPSSCSGSDSLVGLLFMSRNRAESTFPARDRRMKEDTDRQQKGLSHSSTSLLRPGTFVVCWALTKYHLQPLLFENLKQGTQSPPVDHRARLRTAHTFFRFFR